MRYTLLVPANSVKGNPETVFMHIQIVVQGYRNNQIIMDRCLVFSLIWCKILMAFSFTVN